MKKTLCCAAVLCLALVFATASPSADQETATLKEVFDQVVKASLVVGELGEDAFPAFNDPDGEFVWKDTYVFVVNCEKGVVEAHPYDQIRGLPADRIKCSKTGRQFMLEACSRLDDQGTWFEYWWFKPGDKENIYRKIGFAVPVPGTPYQVGSGIYDETTSIEELNRQATQGQYLW